MRNAADRPGPADRQHSALIGNALGAGGITGGEDAVGDQRRANKEDPENNGDEDRYVVGEVIADHAVLPGDAQSFGRLCHLPQAMLARGYSSVNKQTIQFVY